MQYMGLAILIPCIAKHCIPKMNTDRFKNYKDDVKQLVLDFESMEKHGDCRYFDVDQLETIIDFYLDTADGEMMEKSILYGEKLFPSSTEIRLRRVHLLCFKEKYREAFKLLKQLEQVEPENTDTLYALGVVYSALSQPRKAIQYYHKAAADGYELGTIFSNIADEYVKMEQLGDARNYYRKALRVNPDDEHALYELANCYEDDGLTDNWIHYYNRFVEEHPYSKVAWFCLGEAFIAEGLYEKAVNAYQYAITIDADYYYAYTQLASCYASMEDYQNAISTLHDAVDHTEDKAYVYYRIAEIFKHINNLVTANIYYRKAVHEDPFYAEAWHSLAICYSMSHSHDAAIDAAKRALKIDPESPVFLTTMALVYAESGDSENAERFFDCATPYYTDFEQGWLAYAEFLISQQRFDDAIDILNRGLPECEMVVEFNKRLALCYFVTNRRNMLFNAVRACLLDGEEGARDLIEYVPEITSDIDVMNIIDSHN